MAYLPEELLARSESPLPPQNPSQGIPKQRVPKPIRLLVLSFLLPFLYLDLCAQWVAKKIIRPPFERVGNCKRRGNCCRFLLFPKVKGPLGSLFLFWHTHIQGFYVRGELTNDPGEKEHLVMGCRYLKENGSCANYRLRPKVCRTWPLVSYFGYPKLLKGCGYEAKLTRKGAKQYPTLHTFKKEL